MTEATPTRAHRPWALWLLVVLMAAGAAIGVYMARHHEVELYGGEAYQGEALVGCAEAEGVSCDIVNTSEWSEILGVPTFAWAVPTYVGLAVLAVLAARGRHGLKPVIGLVGLATVGLSGWLFYVSKVQLGYVCLWCLRLYGVNAAIPVLALISGVRRDDRPTSSDLGAAAGAFAVLGLVTVGVQQGYRASLLAGTPAVALADTHASEPGAPKDDPKGPAPALTFDVTSEDGNARQVVVRPGDAWKGNPDAKVAIVEFADLECGYCRRASAQLRRLYEAYADEIVFVYKHFPMDPTCNPGVKNKKHARACNAHVGAVCAQDQGRFWAFHDLVYKNQHDLSTDALLGYAKTVGVDMAKFEACVQDPASMERVRASAADGAAVDVHGTPRVWIGGQLYRSGASAEQMARAVEAALGRSGAPKAAAVAGLDGDGALPSAIPADVPEMRRVSHGGLSFEIDTFEAGVADGKATVGKHQVPGVRMSWYAARDACAAAGKRLCTEQEWLAACQSALPVDDDGDGAFADDMIEGNAYPYADFHTPGRCWEAKDDAPLASAAGAPAAAEPWRPVYTGEMPACVTPDGVYDLAGNVEEWVGDSPEKAALMGGAFDTPDDKARCYRRNDTFGAGYASLRTGFRCCR